MNSRRRVLAALEEAGDYVSGEALAARLGVSRAAVWKHVRALAGAGYEIESVRSRGYRLLAAPDAVDAAALRGLLAGSGVGSRVVCLDVTRSTNADAMGLGREGEPEGTVVLAEEQTAGRGRLGRTWESSRGVNLYLSVLLRPSIPIWNAPQLSLVAGVAVAEIGREEGIDCGIKWPNDVVVGGRRKLAGILTEIEAEADRVAFVVVGIGVNVNAKAEHFSAELEGKATSMLIESGKRRDRTALAAKLLARLDECYRAYLAGGFAALAPRWRGLAVLDGRRVEVASPGESFAGVCAGIDDDGGLLVDDDAGVRRRVLAGDVTLEGAYGPCEP